MNGPWSETARAWTAVPAAWGQGGEGPVVAVAVGQAGAALTVPAAVPVAVTRPVCPLVTVATAPGTGLAVLAATADCRAAALEGGVVPVWGLAVGFGPVGAGGLVLGKHPVQATMTTAAPIQAAHMAVTPGPCLAGTGRREVARLSSPPTTGVRLFSPVCLKRSLRSPIDIEQT